MNEQRSITNNTAVSEKPVLLRMENIEKAFPGVKALDKVNLTVKRAPCTRLWAKTAPANQHL